METIQLTLPIYWVNHKGTTQLVGMNLYRNANYFVKHKLTSTYYELIKPMIDPKWDLKNCSYVLKSKLFYKNALSDGSNIVPVIEKFLLDGLQIFDVTSEDNVKYMVGSTWEIGGLDKINPRLEITITKIGDITPNENKKKSKKVKKQC